MKRHLTKIDEPMTILSAGETDSGSAEVQPARDSQAKATNCRWDGAIKFCRPLYQTINSEPSDASKKPLAEGKFISYKELIVKGICPFHAEPLHHNVHRLLLSSAYIVPNLCLRASHNVKAYTMQRKYIVPNLCQRASHN
jgi:hypothetical protein